ncbi:MAG: hypothetical protein HY556_02640 [Euryarchaeota archaeon]|nr:hypothetical protein [Euryarchaeota archaeon]
MSVHWFVDLNAEEEKIVPKLDEIVRKGTTANHGKVLGGPYHPQTSSLLYISEYNTAEDFQRAGKWTLDEINKAGLGESITPVKYEIAVKCGEVGGP